MNKLFILFVSVFLSASLFSQDYYRSYDHHDIRAGYGLFIPDQFIPVKSHMLDELYPGSRYVRDNYSSIGTIFLTYRHIFRNELFMWGVTAGMSNSKSEIYNVGQYGGELKRSFYTVAVEWDYRYVNQGPIQVYSGIGLGFSYATEEFTPSAESTLSHKTGNISNIAYQLNAVGVRLGKKYGGFIEFGYGYKGLVNAGFSLQLF